MVEITRHFTSSVYIVFEDKILLHQHKKLDILLPPGGHIDRDELPIEAALREVKEECGVNIEIISDSNFEKFVDNSYETNVGEFCNVHFVNPHHQHIDFVFIAKAFNTIVKPNKGESKNWFWMSKEEVKEHTQINPAVKKYALYALEKLTSKN
ncbi:MAG: NUDIX domain-containing protein [Nanoarchaeota archaeon]|nr:NUDIX domain-containing protein [Nanoarchaeota archaeon]